MDEATLRAIQARYGIIGDSPGIRSAVEKLAQVGPTDLTVLINGETGTGKEVFANALHGLSRRRRNAFVSVNCAAIPETLLESELFGHEKGAFTGAVEQRKGFFEAADGGTIFLDEIGEMPLGTQSKMLRVLESGEFSRVGSPEVKRVDVRLVAATNRDLEYEVRQGRFRQDLLFRLNSVVVVLPSLRHHTEDLDLLVDYFAQKVARDNKFVFQGISAEAMNILRTHSWPGNVRELRNFIETVVTLENGHFIDPTMVHRHLKRTASTEAQPTTSIIPWREPETDYRPQVSDYNLIFKTLLEIRADISDMKKALLYIFEKVENIESLEKLRAEPAITAEVIEGISDGLSSSELQLRNIEKQAILGSLQRNKGNKSKAAKELGISSRTLYRKLVEYGVVEGGEEPGM